VKDYDGGVDFARETKNVNFMRTGGKDLTIKENPFRPSDINRYSNLKQIRDRVYTALAMRCSSFDDLVKVFKDMDVNGSNTIDPVEFKNGMK